MAKNNVLCAGMIAALCAFSSQANKVSHSIDNTYVASKKVKRSDEIDLSEKINFSLNDVAKQAISTSHVLCQTLDMRYTELLKSPESLSDEAYSVLILLSNTFNSVDVLFKMVMSDNEVALSDKDSEIFNEVYKSYKITSRKLNNLANLAKQIKEVPEYFESDIDLVALNHLVSHSKTVII